MIEDEAEVWADGYSFIEFQHTGTGLVPYHYESAPPRLTQPAVVAISAAEYVAEDNGKTFTLMA
jgi:hypothetical protein